jgi:Glutathione-dependent formaldehyde-activating enzyme
MKIDGACHCGYITVEGEADPEKTTVCHCTDCQVGTGSAFRVNVPVPGATFRIKGQPATYLKTSAESGNPRLQAFLSALRLADLFDLAGRGPAGVLHGAGGNLAPAQ